MTRKSKTASASGYTVLLVDDNPEYLEATQFLLQREGHTVLTATHGSEALSILRQQPVDLLLLDYFMPGMTGEEVVKQLRQFNPLVQVILQTGYASEQPPREMLRRLDIQGYHDKGEGPDKLLMWTDVGLKAAYTLQLLNKSRQGLKYILDVTPDLHKLQPLTDLLQGILWQVTGLLGVVNSFVAILPQGSSRYLPPDDPPAEGFVAMVDDDAELVIRASTGRFAGEARMEASLDATQAQVVKQALQRGAIHVVEATTVVPLRVGELTLGVIYLDRPVVVERDVELLQIFANQASVAIQNSQLYQMATRDPLTGLFVRRFFDQCLYRELRTAFRGQHPLALLLIDLDSLKQINDTAGHLAGDQALAMVGKILLQATRGSDIVGRYGGDEFAVILPQTRAEDAERVARRILEALQDQQIASPAGPVALPASLGACVLEAHAFRAADIPRPIPQAYFRDMAQAMIQCADEALYQAKGEGGRRVIQRDAIPWKSFSDEPA
jgi:diguanylate cyclase (GGDEF)-like protein